MEGIMSFSRKQLKKDACLAVRHRFFLNVILIFLVTVLVRGGYYYATQTIYDAQSSEVAAEDAKKYIAGRKTNSQVLEDLLNEQKVVKVETSADTVSKKYTKGVLSVFVNEITSSRSIAFGILNGINTLAFKGKVGKSITIFLMAVLELLYMFFIKNTIIIGKNRYFLEHRRYRRTRIDRLLFLPRFGKMGHADGIMARRYIYQILWMCTIVMGPVKFYEYRMIPYILAENPDITYQEAFALSKEMSNGRKMEMFKLDLSMIGWLVLGALTFNASNVFWFYPYRECVYAELYISLREQVKSDIFIDEYLNPALVADSEYPENYFPLRKHEYRRWLAIDYHKNYTLQSYILLFFTFSFVGWCWEVMLNLMMNGTFVNRGVLLGPWLPIYGTGAVMVLIALKPFRDKPFLLFLATMILCGILEYSTSWGLEQIFHKQWWSYKGYFMNLNGRICLEGLLVFGLGGSAATYVAAPLLENLFEKIPPKQKKILCAVLIALFLGDAAHSCINPNTGDGITC